MHREAAARTRRIWFGCAESDSSAGADRSGWVEPDSLFESDSRVSGADGFVHRGRRLELVESGSAAPNQIHGRAPTARAGSNQIRSLNLIPSSVRSRRSEPASSAWSEPDSFFESGSRVSSRSSPEAAARTRESGSASPNQIHGRAPAPGLGRTRFALCLIREFPSRVGGGSRLRTGSASPNQLHPALADQIRSLNLVRSFGSRGLRAREAGSTRESGSAAPNQIHRQAWGYEPDSLFESDSRVSAWRS